jgi:hypothetical protein
MAEQLLDGADVAAGLQQVGVLLFIAAIAYAVLSRA